MSKSDAELKKSIIRELEWDTRVDETEIGVAVKEGVVTLTGVVDSWGKRLAAQDASRRVAGVLDIANDITARVPGAPERSDTEIARAVRDALEWNVFVPEKRIRSTVSNGWVTLEGNVEYWNQRDDAEYAVRNLMHVRGVLNKIDVTPPHVTEADVRLSLDEALARHAARDVGRLAIEVRDGRVSLSGPIHSLAEKQAVLGAARGTPGVREVVDRLHVAP